MTATGRHSAACCSRVGTGSPAKRAARAARAVLGGDSSGGGSSSRGEREAEEGREEELGRSESDPKPARAPSHFDRRSWVEELRRAG